MKRQLSDRAVMRKIARDLERKGPIVLGGFGLCAAIEGRVPGMGQFSRICDALDDYFRDDAKSAGCYGYYWPLTKRGHEQRVIAAWLLSEVL